MEQRRPLALPWTACSLLLSLSPSAACCCTVNRESLSTCHAHALHAWFSAIRAAHGIAAMKEPPEDIHSAYSTGARPNCVVHNYATASQHDKLFELKLPSHIATGHSPLPGAGTSFSSVNTETKLLNSILGAPSDPSKVKCSVALRKCHAVTPIILEVFGGFAHHAQGLLDLLSLARKLIISWIHFWHL
eukprot:6208339-Pleurochrysis_carterae.AAC.1